MLDNLPKLGDRQILLWTLELDRTTEPRFQQLARFLSLEENQRALRFRFERDRRRFVVCRGVLREILGTYLQRDPEEIDFGYGPQGKPYLKGPSQETVGPLHFNLSHSSGWVIYAVGLSAVGVDLEIMRPIPEMEALAERYFSTLEREAFFSIAPALRLKAFLSCWTRKEAYVKARGEGLSLPLDQFDVSVDPNSPAHLISAGGVSGDDLPWALHSFDPSPEAVAALVCLRHSQPLLCVTQPQTGLVGT